MPISRILVSRVQRVGIRARRAVAGPVYAWRAAAGVVDCGLWKIQRLAIRFSICKQGLVSIGNAHRVILVLVKISLSHVA